MAGRFDLITAFEKDSDRVGASSQLLFASIGYDLLVGEEFATTYITFSFNIFLTTNICI